MQNVYVAPPMPIYRTGTISKRVTVAPNSDALIVMKYLRAIQSVFVSSITAPKVFNSTTSGAYTIKIFQFMQEPQQPPSFDDTNGLVFTFKDYWGYVPIQQLCDGGSAHVYVVIRNQSQTETISVVVTGEA